MIIQEKDEIMSKKLTTEIFIERARKIHGNKYDYSKVVYVNCYSLIIIICPLHGEFVQTPTVHLSGRGCQKCGGTTRLTTEEFINKARKIHGNTYDYSKVVYVNTHIEIIIICPKHGEFLQTPNGHLSGKGCMKCSGLEKSTTEKFIIRAKQIVAFPIENNGKVL